VKKTFLIAILLNLTILGWSQHLVVAVLPFDAKNGYSEDEAEVVADLVSSLIVEVGGFDIVSRSQYNRLV
jgi:hypothetical protein